MALFRTQFKILTHLRHTVRRAVYTSYY